MRRPAHLHWRRRLHLIAIAGLLLIGSLTATAALARDLLVFAAASLSGALDEAAATFETRTGHGVALSYAGSSALAKQVAQGAPADLFISADPDWMDYLEQQGGIRPETRHDLLRNRLVLIAPADGDVTVALEPGADLAGALGDGRLAMAEPTAVPAGKYGRAALEALGLWSGVEGRIAAVENVRTALALVARGEAPLGIVYATDALADPDVRVVGTFSAGTHPDIVYPAAITAVSDHPQAEAFLAFLRSEDAARLFAAHGFPTGSPAR